MFNVRLNSLPLGQWLQVALSAESHLWIQLSLPRFHIIIRKCSNVMAINRPVAILELLIESTILSELQMPTNGWWIVANLTRQISGTGSHTHMTTPYSSHITSQQITTHLCEVWVWQYVRTVRKAKKVTVMVKTWKTSILSWICGTVRESVAVLMHGVWPHIRMVDNPGKNTLPGPIQSEGKKSRTVPEIPGQLATAMMSKWRGSQPASQEELQLQLWTWFLLMQ